MINLTTKPVVLPQIILSAMLFILLVISIINYPW